MELSEGNQKTGRAIWYGKDEKVRGWNARGEIGGLWAWS